MSNLSLNPTEIVTKYAGIGEGKAKRQTAPLFVLGILAGVLIAMGCNATNTAVYGIENTWTSRMILGLLFPFGLGMVVLMGAELFTGNVLIVISVLEKKCSVWQMLRSWAVVYAANLAGSLIVAAGCAYFGQLNYSGGQLAVYTMRCALAKCSMPFANALVMGFFCNVLVCLGVLMALVSTDAASRILAAFLPVCYFVISGFEHCVANMYYVPAGLMAKSIPQYAQLAQQAGLDLSRLTIGNFVLGNLLPVTIGNILGGAAIGVLMWYCHVKKK